MVESSRLFQFPNRVACVCLTGLVFAAGVAFGQNASDFSASSSVMSHFAAVSNGTSEPSAEAAILPRVAESKKQEASEASAGQADQAACPKLADSEVPANAVVAARAPGWLDSARLKAGKEIWVKVARPISYPQCAMDEDSVIYGRVMSVSSTKDPNSSELSILFDHADCIGKGKKELRFWLIAVVAPPDEIKPSHDNLPASARLNPGGTPNTVKPGIVVGYPKIKLEPTEGAGCSAKLTSTDKSVHLGTGTELIMTVGRAE